MVVWWWQSYRRVIAALAVAALVVEPHTRQNLAEEVGLGDAERVAERADGPKGEAAERVEEVDHALREGGGGGGRSGATKWGAKAVLESRRGVPR